jgi:hypothetical protein
MDGKGIDRRGFLKAAGAAGIGSALGGGQVKGAEEKSEKKEEAKLPQVPRRKLGSTGMELPILSQGVEFNAEDNQAVLVKSLEWGVNYWDTAPTYAGGRAERGVGKFLKEHPQRRGEIIISTKTAGSKGSCDEKDPPANVEEALKESLKRLNTDYIDMYFSFHGLSKGVHLTDDLRKWVESAKKRGLVRYFGFSTHTNMADCLLAASKLDYIDVIMTAYNFRLMGDVKMQQALDACSKKGIGLVAMKTQGFGQRIESEQDEKLVQHFLEQGFTEGQAKLKLVLEDGRFCSVCTGMENIGLLTENVAAVLDKTKLTDNDRMVFKSYAAATCDGYCAGCGGICTEATGAPVNDVMRYLMYYNSYGDRKRAKELFAKIPEVVRDRLCRIDYTAAQALCPQGLAIGELMVEAVRKLG